MSTRPTPGEVRFEVEWCTHYHVDADGEHDMDSDEFTFKDFRTAAAARKFAKTLKPVGHGLAQIRRKVAVSRVTNYPQIIDWEYDGEVEEIDVPWAEPSGAAKS